MNFDTLDNKAILIEKQAQDRKLRKICKSVGFRVTSANSYNYPYYYILVKTSNVKGEERFLIPNSDLESKSGSVCDLGYVVISILQFEAYVKEHYKKDKKDKKDSKEGGKAC